MLKMGRSILHGKYKMKIIFEFYTWDNIYVGGCIMNYHKDDAAKNKYSKLFKQLKSFFKNEFCGYSNPLCCIKIER